MIVSLHLTHLSAGLKELNDLQKSLHNDVGKSIAGLPGVEEYVVVSTCNRFEVYIGTDLADRVRDGLQDLVRAKVVYEKGEAPVYYLQDKQTISHLFRVVCGMDSLIVGEDQIQNQIKEAYSLARDEGHVGPRLSRLFEKALSVGKRVRSETGLNNGAVSVGSAAVQLAEENLGTLRGATVTVVGAGEMATSIARSLMGKGPRTVFVSNRTYENARELAHQLDGKAIGRDALPKAIIDSDVVLVATAAPHMILTRDMIEPAMNAGKEHLLIVDISMPSNVDPAVSSLPGVELVTLEGLQEVALRNVAARHRELIEAERIVEEELSRWLEEAREAQAIRIISEIGQKVSCIREQELTKALRRMECDIDCRLVFEDFSRALVSKIMADPINRLKEACRNGEADICHTAKRLFDVEME